MPLSLVHVEPLLVVAVGPWDDVRSAQERGIGDAGEGAVTAPVVHESIAEYVLADALDHQPPPNDRRRAADDLAVFGTGRDFPRPPIGIVVLFGRF